jgi:hypothetical protein
VAVWFIEAVKARTDFFPSAVEWNTSIPQIIVGSVIKGNLSTAQGIPPTLAFIWINTFEMIDLRFLPR